MNQPQRLKTSEKREYAQFYIRENRKLKYKFSITRQVIADIEMFQNHDPLDILAVY